MTVRVEAVDAAVTARLRLAVLRGGADVPVPGDGPGAVHLAAVDDAGRVVGAAALLPEAWSARPEVAPAWQLRGMAVDASTQGTGVGSAVLRAAVAELETRGAVLLWCIARSTAVPFYERHGFTFDGPEFVVEAVGLPHKAMWRELTAHATSS